MPWIKGFCVEKNNKYISEGRLSTSVSLEPEPAHEGALSFDTTDKCVVIDDDFCIVMSHQIVEENIKVPFAFGYIKKEDFL